MLIVPLFLSAAFSLLMHSENRQLSPLQLNEDVGVLRKNLEKYHPGIYWYTSKERFDQTWDSLTLHIRKPMSDAEFLKLVLPVVAKVQCAHTLFYPSKEILATGSRFPFDVKFINGRGYIISDSSNESSIPKGSELLSINGQSMKEIVQLLLPSLEAQGGNPGWKYVILENDFHNYYYYEISQADNFRIEYINHENGQKEFVMVSGSSSDVRRRHWKNWYSVETGPPLKMNVLAESSTAVISIRSFSRGRYVQYKQDFNKLIEQYFKEIQTKAIRNLIIDVRGNEGGNNSDKVYSYIAREHDHNTDGTEFNILKTIPRFSGDVIVLTNERTISAQESLVSIFKK
jgi:hypothetical protein